MNEQLSDTHLKMLRDGSGISDQVIEARGYKTITDENELITFGFSPVQRRTPGLLIPSYSPDGANGFYSYRPDFARVITNKRQRNADGRFRQRVVKYETPTGSGLRIDCPPVCCQQMKDPKTPLWITEGAKKADALASHGLCAISLSGVYG